MFRFFTVSLCALFSLALLVAPQLLDRRLLFQGAESYVFYTQSASSQAEMLFADAEHAASVKLTASRLTGESATFATAEEALAQAERYGARLLFTQTTGDVVDRYYYSPQLGAGVRLQGHTVNLHISVRGGSGCAGSPLIFGGY